MGKETKKHAALFDLDGVLIDTEGIYSGFWGAMGRRYDVGIEDFADVIKGTTLDQILNKYFDAGSHAQIVEELIDFERNMRYELFQGVEDFLCQLERCSIPKAIVTSSGDKKLGNLFSQIAGFKEHFDAIISDAQVTRSKPDPQGYLLAAEALGCNPVDCYVFEDSYNGLLAGRRSGAKVIALATTNPAESLSAYADLVIPSFAGFTIEAMLNV